MQTSEMPCRRTSLTVSLDPLLMAQIELCAQQQLLSVEDYVKAALQLALQRDLSRPSRKAKIKGAERESAAPLDAFLPAGVDPFVPAEPSPALATSFEELQTRLRFAGTPSLLLGLD